MRVLVALPNPPDAEGTAAGRCSYGLLQGLGAHGVECACVAATTPDTEHGTDVPAEVPVEIVPVPTELGGWRGRWQRVRRPQGHLARTAFGDRVRELAPEFDVLYLDQVETAWCDEGLSTPSVLHLHHLVRADRSPPAPWTAEFRSFAKATMAEWWGTRRHDHLVANSPRVAEELRRWAPKASVVRAPLCLSPARYTPAGAPREAVAGFLGTATWPPTAVAAHRLVGDVWPLVRGAEPHSRLVVAGRGMDSLIAGDRDRAVESIGSVDSAAGFLGGLSVLLYPVPRGSGMKVKVLEAMAMGVPVVTTMVGAEGIEPNDGVVVADDVRLIAGAAASILRDPKERAERSLGARNAFEAHYSPVPATAPLVELLESVSRQA